MKKAIIILYVIVAVQSAVVAGAFAFYDAVSRKAFEHAGRGLLEICDRRYILRSEL